MVTLRNGGKSKDFKLNLVSDCLCSKAEFENLQRQNKNLTIDEDFIVRMKKQFKEANKI